MANNAMTKEEYQYLESAKNYQQLLSKMEDKVASYENQLGQYEKYRTEDKNQINQLSNHVNKLVRDLSEKESIINHDKLQVAEYKTYYDKFRNLERHLTLTESHHKNLIGIKDLAIERLEREKDELQSTIDDLEEQLSEYEDETDEDDDDEPVYSQSLDEGLFPVEVSNREDGGLIDDSDDDKYEMPPEDKGLELYEKKTQEVLKLIDGGHISLEQIEQLNEIKKNLGGNLKKEPVLSENEITEQAMKIALKVGGGKVLEEDLQKIKGVTFDSGGITKLARGGSLTLKKNFFRKDYSILE